MSRDELATLFWPDRPQEAARSNLRKLLQEVRALALPQLESDRNSVRWIVSTDVADYKAALERGDSDAAVALYRGPALRGLDGGESEAFSSLARGRAPAAARGVARCRGRAAAAPRPGRRAALAGGCSTTTRSMRTRWSRRSRRTGRSATARGAARTFRGYAERLIEELGVEPSARVRLGRGGAGEAAARADAAPRRRAAPRDAGRRAGAQRA